MIQDLRAEIIIFSQQEHLSTQMNNQTDIYDKQGASGRILKHQWWFVMMHLQQKNNYPMDNS